MERRPQDIEADPNLRPEYVAQISWDEFVEQQLAEIEEESPAVAADIRDSPNHPVYQYWDHLWMSEALRPDTRIVEIFYLKGHTERSVRLAAIDQIHSRLREAAQQQGLFQIPPVEGVEEFNLEEGE